MGEGMERAGTAVADRRTAELSEPERGGQLATVSPMVRAMGQAQMGLMPSTLGEATLLAGKLAQATCIPRSLRGKPQNVLAVILQGVDLGLTPMNAVNNISIISGNMAMRVRLQLALIRRSGQLDYYDAGFDDTNPDPMKHFGWCEMKRRGDESGNVPADPATGKPRRHRREFSRAMAAKVEIRTREEDEDGGQAQRNDDGSKPKKFLADQFAYKNWPERMYPARATSWLIDQLFPDITLGMPSVESLEAGQVIEAEYTVDAPQHQVADAQELLDAIAADEPEAAEHIEQGFEALAWGPPKRLVALRKFQGKPAQDLLDYLKDEYAAAVKGRERAKPSANHPVEVKQQPAVQDGQVVEDPKPAAEPEPTKQPEPKTPAPEPAKAKTASERLKGAKDLNFD